MNSYARLLNLIQVASATKAGQNADERDALSPTNESVLEDNSKAMGE